MTIGATGLLHLTDNLACFRQRFDHLLALFPPSNGVIAFFQEIVELAGAIHLFQELFLHLIFGMPENRSAFRCFNALGHNISLLNESEHDRFGDHVNQCFPGDVEVRIDE